MIFPTSPPGPQSWRERLSALRHVPSMLKLVWKADRAYTTAMIALRLIRSFIPVAILWVGKLIIDTIVASRGGNSSYRQLWNLVLLELAIVVIRDLLTHMSNLVESLLADLFKKHTSERIMAHAASLDLYQFENPAFCDQLERAHEQATNRFGLLPSLLSMAQDFVTLMSLGAALFMYSPLLILLLTITVIPSFFGETYFATLEYLLFRHRTGARRHLEYLRYVGTSKATAKEVQLFGLSSWLISRFRKLYQHLYRENKSLHVRKATVISGFQVFGTLGYYAAYTIILVRAVEGSVTLGMLTFLAGSFARARDLINIQLIGASNVFSQALFLKDLFDFFKMKASITSAAGSPVLHRPISGGISFDDVSFRYPGSDKWAVRNVSFELRPGEHIAFIGENGAGKTTITKLLARLYDPTEGRILLDGRDIREYDLQSLRRAIGVIFQDFVCYDWQFDENIGVGEIEEVKSYLTSLEVLKTAGGTMRFNNGKNDGCAAESLPVPSSIISAAEKSLASTLLPRFTDGYRQMLGQRFDGGIELSGGEWQKVALARAYMRDAQIIILDEPTAALDARAEYEVFKRFSRLVAGRMAVIISHRFSTVRRADRILVLQKGVVLEEGAHDDLVASGGLYAELFTLQAEGYR